MSTEPILPRRFVQALAVTFVAWIIFGVLLNPFFSDQYLQSTAILAAEAIAALLVITVAFFRAWRIDTATAGRAGSVSDRRFDDDRALVGRSPGSSFARFVPWLILLLIFLGALVLRRTNIRHAFFIDDDRMTLQVAQSWELTRFYFWKPFNEHLLLPTRIWAFAAVQLTTPETLQRSLIVGIWVLYGVTLVQVFLLARREFGGDAPGLIAVAAFALTSVYHECLWWFMAAQWLWTLDILLATWLILDPARPSAQRANAATALAFAAPFTFSIGLLVGPCAAVWILCRWRSGRGVWWRPLVGTLLGLLITMPLIRAGLKENLPLARSSMAQWFELNLWNGLAATARISVDYLLLINLGVAPRVIPDWAPHLLDKLGYRALWAPMISALLFPLLAAVPLLVLRARPACWRLAPFIVLLVLNYGVVMPFRSWMDYPQMSNWTARYHMLPLLGVVLFLVGSWAAGRSPETRSSLKIPLLVVLVLFVYQEATHGYFRFAH